MEQKMGKNHSRFNYTLEEIFEIHDRAENFRGTKPNFGKIQLYRDMKNDAIDFMDESEAVIGRGGFDPNPREKRAMLWLDLAPAGYLFQDEAQQLASLLTRADLSAVMAVKNHVRVSFFVDVWDE